MRPAEAIANLTKRVEALERAQAEMMRTAPELARLLRDLAALPANVAVVHQGVVVSNKTAPYRVTVDVAGGQVPDALCVGPATPVADDVVWLLAFGSGSWLCVG